MSANRSGLILLADGDADSRHIYGEYLMHHGFQVVSVLTGFDALTLAPGADAVVTESHLPGDLDGLELVARLKNDNLTTGIPVVVVSAYAWDTDRRRAERAGCDLFLTKPCLPGELMCALKRLLSQSPRRTADRRLACRGSLPNPHEQDDDLESEGSESEEYHFENGDRRHDSDGLGDDSCSDEDEGEV
jgi:CheY-like chemotaxis protein